MVSYATVGIDLDRIDPSNSFYPYVEAKHGADAYLRNSDLDYTILGPGHLTLDPSNALVTIADERGDIEGRTPGDGQGVTSRELVADVITYVIVNDAAVRETVNFYDGSVPLAEAIG